MARPSSLSVFGGVVLCVLASATAAAAEAASDVRGADAAAGASAAPPDTPTLAAQGCLACHSVDGAAGPGPSFRGLWGRTERVVTDGAERDVVVDAAYVARSLREPNADVRVGFTAGTMPTYALGEAAEAAVVAELRALAPPPPAPPPPASVWSLLLATLAFVLGHFLLSATPVRALVEPRVGKGAYAGLYSLVALPPFVWMIIAYNGAPFIPLWPTPGWTHWVPLVLMPLALAFAVGGYSTPSPTSAMADKLIESAAPVQGWMRITRHPVNWANVIWAAGHLAANGDAATVILAGGIAVLSLGGMIHIDARRRKEFGERWRPVDAATSLVPFAAILSGRQTLSLREIGAVRLFLPLALYVAILFGHEYAFGVSPWPY